MADPVAYMIRLRFITGLQNCEHHSKVLEPLQRIADATLDVLLLVNLQRKQVVSVREGPERNVRKSLFCREQSITKENNRK